MADPRLKQIRIKTGVVNRIAKEKQSYETETENEKGRLLKIKDNGKSRLTKVISMSKLHHYLTYIDCYPIVILNSV